MNGLCRSHQKRLLVLALLCLFAGSVDFSLPAPAQGADIAGKPSGGQRARGGKVRYQALDGSRKGRSGQRRGAGTSGGSCGANNSSSDQPLTALIPELDVQGTTIEAYPTLWFYVPYAMGDFDSMLFVLRDETGTPVETKLTATNSLPGVISLRVTGKSLALNQKYDWQFIVYCQSGNREGRYVSGSVVRIPVSSTLQRELSEAATPLDKAAAYAQNGVWFDALTILGNGRSGNVDLNGGWADLLEGVGLKDVSSKRGVDCCKPSGK